MTRQEFDETVRRIKGWLTDEGIFRSQIPDENAHYHFQIEFPAGSSHLMGIVFPKPREDIILIIGGATLSPEHRERLNAMSPQEKKKLLWDMRFDLLFKESEFTMIPSAEDFQQIQFLRPLRLDGINMNLMMDA